MKLEGNTIILFHEEALKNINSCKYYKSTKQNVNFKCGSTTPICTIRTPWVLS